MNTPPSPDAFHDTTQKRPVTPGTVIAALLIPVVAALGVVTSLQVQDIDRDWVERQQAACQHMPFPKMEHVAAWAGPILGISAVVVCVLLAKQIRRHYRLRLWDTWPGLVAFVSVSLNVPAMLLELFMLWATYTPDGSGPILGDCG
ncbi:MULTISPECIES: hypothetical protein [unclassified Streptomyces]|uniref:hypothetical protein n=1 Tax=unclassified Streptomyces TaxID=2593676 RepID=UPI001BE98801|nr:MULTISPECIES: hypothetical protein [unclassified Streptomyces]MBT2407527.1 hypothetical protein [Streptomyces sp. ISL-21]MBT2608134.1 hypothetical protein [Streptomyces sp. ISL-87]